MKRIFLNISCMKPINILYIVFFMIFVSCTERIDINTDDAPPQLVIYGYITTETKAHTITISQSTGYFATTKPGSIADAQVTISSEDGIDFFLTYKGNGVYQTEDNVRGEEGKTYSLKVIVDFNNDGISETYEASSYLPLAAEMDTITLASNSRIDEVVEIRVTGTLPQKQQDDQNYFSMHAYRNGEIVNDSLKHFELFGDKYIKTRNIENLACFYLDQEKEKSVLKPGDKVILRIDAITKAYADFIEEAQSEVRGTIPMFSGPPANVKTNIRCTRGNGSALGFFTAYSSREKETVYTP